MATLDLECFQDPLIWLFLASVALVTILQRRRSGDLPLPPGPKPMPIIGNMMMANQLTHRGLASLAEQYGGLLHLRLGRLHVIAVTKPELAREVLLAPDGAFSNRPATLAIAYLTYGRSNLIFSHGGAHVRRMRKLCGTTLFSRRRAETWLAVRDGYGGALAHAVATRSGEAVDIGELVFSHIVGVIFRAAFSLNSCDEGGLDELAILRVFSRIMGEFHVGDFFPWLGWMGRRGFNRRLYSARSALDGFIDKIVDDHVRRGKNPADADADLVDGLLALLAESEANLASGKDTLRFTGDNVKAVIMDMLFGGPEPLRLTIEWAMVEMVRNPNTLMRLQNELADVVGLDRIVDDSDLDKLPFLGCVVKERLRVHPPIPMLLHEATHNCVLGGYSVPRGSRIMINMWAINRDREAWKDNSVFRPSRFMPGEGEVVDRDLKGGSFEFLPFGSGPRSCPAQGLGLHVVKFAIAQLIQGFNWELPGGMKPTEIDMGDISSLTASHSTRLYVVPTTRLTCPI